MTDIGYNPVSTHYIRKGTRKHKILVIKKFGIGILKIHLIHVVY